MRTVSIAGHDGFKVGQAARKSAQRPRPHPVRKMTRTCTLK